MKTIVKNHTAALAFLFYVGAILMAIYASTRRPPDDEAMIVAYLTVVLATLLLVRAITMKTACQNDGASIPGELRSIEIEPGKLIYVGTQRNFLAQGEPPEVETVSLAAIKDYSGVVYAGQAPIDHATIRKWFNKEYNAPICCYGWITNTGRFVSEEEAWDIAVKSKQLHQNSRSNGYLTAEEIWPNVYLQKAA